MREVLNPPYIQTPYTPYSDMVPLWLYKRPSLTEGETSFHLSV